MKLRMPGIIVVLWQAIRAWFDDDVRRLGALLALQDSQAVFNEGTPEEKEEFIRLFVELDAEKRVAVCRIKKFPAPSCLDAGKLSLKLVAGMRDEQQQIVFPPVDAIEIIWLAFTTSKCSRPTIRRRRNIYDVAERRVREVLNERRDRGAYRAPWDGRNDDGSQVASGVYFYKLVAGRSRTQRR